MRAGDSPRDQKAYGFNRTPGGNLRAMREISKKRGKENRELATRGPLFWALGNSFGGGRIDGSTWASKGLSKGGGISNISATRRAQRVLGGLRVPVSRADILVCKTAGMKA